MMGPIYLVRKLLMFCKNELYFWLGPIYKLFKSHVNYALMWILRILGPIKFCKGHIKISNGQLKFGNLHVFEWDMGHWPILRAHHHFGLGLSLKTAKIRKLYNQVPHLTQDTTRESKKNTISLRKNVIIWSSTRYLL